MITSSDEAHHLKVSTGRSNIRKSFIICTVEIFMYFYFFILKFVLSGGVHC